MTNAAPLSRPSASSAAVLQQLSPPGRVDDLAGHPELLDLWSSTLRGQFMRHGAAGEPRSPHGGARLTPPVDPAAVSDPATRVVTWNAFPKRISAHFGSAAAAWEFADTPYARLGHTVRLHDEYVEWFVERDAATGKIVRVTFTSELPDYWRFLAYLLPDFVFQSYQRFVGPQVPRAEVFPGGPRYSALNRWNGARGMVHMQHDMNTLQATLTLLAAGAGFRSLRAAGSRDDPELLLSPSRGGDPCRASDVTISSAADELATAGYLVTLLDPVGVYLGELNTAGWTRPDGQPVGDYWQVVRGAPDYPLRAVYEVPAAEGFAVGDLKIGGRPIEYGGQLADHLTVKLTLLGYRE
jgi:hypothetical protein